VIAWQQQRFLDHWRCLSEPGTPGRPAIAKEIRALIQDMWQANPTWGAPRIVGELHKLGIDVAKSTVEKYHVRLCKPPLPPWKAFLNNHVKDLVSLDFFVVPTVTRKVLFVLVIMAHERRRVVHVNVTEHPTAAWTAQQVVDAFPWEEAPRYLLRDRDGAPLLHSTGAAVSAFATASAGLHVCLSMGGTSLMASPGAYRAVWGVPEEPSHGRCGHRRTTGLHGASTFSLDAFVVVTDKGQQSSRAQGIAVTMAVKTNRSCTFSLRIIQLPDNQVASLRLVVYPKRADKSIRLACRPSPRQNGTDQQVMMPSQWPSERRKPPQIRPNQHTSPSEVPSPSQLRPTVSYAHTRWLRPWRYTKQQHLA
jgi:hypothetical protein